jgi:CDP-glucose 4,6-dehydratase
MALTKTSATHGEAFNFGPGADQNHSVLELVREMSLHWDSVRWEDVSSSRGGPRESGLLKLDCDKARHRLHWHAVLDFPTTVRMTAEWYRNFYSDASAAGNRAREQIADYTGLAREQGLEWAQ